MLHILRATGNFDTSTEHIKELTTWTSAKVNEYKVLADQRDVDGTMIDNVMDIVKQFIISRQLILYGGLAIDYALKLKGSGIYPDSQRPDFDFFSDRSVEDAYDLADILIKAGYRDVGALRAIHVQTMRVRVDSIFVADIGYAPPDVFNKIPTFDYNGMRVTHPDFQRMDMHMALCFPFNNPPREDVFHRWSKDLKRFNLVDQYYPITISGNTGHGPLGVHTIIGKLNIPVIGDHKCLVAHHGFTAYSLFRSALDELLTAFNMVKTINAPHLKLAFPDTKSVSIEMPVESSSVIMVSPWPTLALTEIKDYISYSPYMDITPESFQIVNTDEGSNTTILSVTGRLLSSNLMKVGNYQAYVVSIQYLLMWLLSEAHRTPPGNIYRTFYKHTMEIINVAEDAYIELISRSDSKTKKSIIESFATSPFAPILTTIGEINVDASYIIKMAGNAQTMKDTPPEILHLAPNIADILIGLPRSYYPENASARPMFDYSANRLFKRSGTPF